MKPYKTLKSQKQISAFNEHDQQIPGLFIEKMVSDSLMINLFTKYFSILYIMAMNECLSYFSKELEIIVSQFFLKFVSRLLSACYTVRHGFRFISHQLPLYIVTYTYWQYLLYSVNISKVLHTSASDICFHASCKYVNHAMCFLILFSST